jgi:hypothetical protein
VSLKILPTSVPLLTNPITDVIPTNLNISTDSVVVGLAKFVLPFVPLDVIKTLLVLEPLSLYPNRYPVGGAEWKRATEIASDLFERCPGREFARNMTEFKPVWKCEFCSLLFFL